ncbi:MAG: ABC transporter ATP-binding protein [Lachnospiraceae bacterium]|jgi:ATP-binding cassette subfamily B multidrug efflux pump
MSAANPEKNNAGGGNTGASRDTAPGNTAMRNTAQRGSSSAKHGSSLLRKHIGAVVAGNIPLLVLMILSIAASVGASLIPPLILEKIVSRLTGGLDISFPLALSYFLFIVLSDVWTSLQNSAITIFGQKLTHGIRSALCAKLSRLPADYFHTHSAGATASIFTNDGDAIDVLYSDGIVSMFADCFRLIAVVAVIFTRSAGLGILIAVLTPLLYLFTRFCQKHMRQAQLDNRRAIAKVNSHVPETLRCIRMIRSFHAEKHMEDTYNGYISDSYDAVNRTNIIDSIYSPVILVTQAAVIAVMMIFAARGGSSAAFFGVSVGSAVAMIAYVNSIFTPLGNIGMEIQNIQAAAAAVEHIEEFLNEPEWQPKTDSPDTPSSEIVFDHVTFGYRADWDVLNDLSFRIDQGESVVFAGRTGAGKSTIFRLLTGQYEPRKGTIGLMGQNPCAVKPEEKRELYGYVEQSFQTVPGTVRDQITLYDSSCSDEEIQKAVRMAGLTETVEALPKGLDTPMDAGTFSKGQLQLLAIARAVVKNPKILLLDEITASLDSETEARVIAALRNSSEGRTVVSISHRLSSAIGSSRLIEIRPAGEA